MGVRTTGLMLYNTSEEQNLWLRKKRKPQKRIPAKFSISICAAECGGESKVTKFAGFGRKGFYVVCEKNARHVGRLR